MEIVFSSKAKKDLEFWYKSGNKSIIKKISELLRQFKKTHLKELESRSN